MDGGLLYQILDEATFYWFQRCHAVDSPFYSLKNLIQLDRRLAGLLRLLPTLDGFSEALNKGFTEEYGDEFYCLLAATASSPKADLYNLIDASILKGADYKEITAILSWLPYKSIHNCASQLWESNIIDYQHIALACWRNHRVKTGINIIGAIKNEQTSIACSAVRFIGEMGLTQHITDIEDLLSHNDEQLRFWATYSIILLGGNKGLKNMFSAIQNKTDNCNLAILSAYPILSPQEATAWVNKLSQNNERLQEAIKSFEVMGLTKFIPWLISLLKDQALAPFAAHAFCTITGMKVQSEDFGDLLPLFGDPNAAMSEDLHLAAKSLKNIDFNELWNKYHQHFALNVRFFSGRKIDTENLNGIIDTGNQQQRKRAAIELAILNPSEPLFQHQAPGFRQ